MFFKKSIERDGSLKQLLVEELALEQMKFHQDSQQLGESGWMSMPWSLNLLKVRLAFERRRASKTLLASIIHAATQLARDMLDRRTSELAEAECQGPLRPEEREELAGLFQFMDKMPDIASPAEALLLSHDRRAEILKHSDQAVHRLRVLSKRCRVSSENPDEVADRVLSGMSSAELSVLFERAKGRLTSQTDRPAQYRFDLEVDA